MPELRFQEKNVVHSRSQERRQRVLDRFVIPAKLFVRPIAGFRDFVPQQSKADWRWVVNSNLRFPLLREKALLDTASEKNGTIEAPIRGLERSTALEATKMMGRIAEASPRLKARVTGALYLVVILTGIFAQGFVSGRLVE